MTAGDPARDGSARPNGATGGDQARETRGGSRAGNPVPEASVASMFDAIAPVYDRMNTLMTAGRDGGWRKAAVRATGLSAGGRVLDVACGTGKLTCALAATVGSTGHATGLDLAPVMIDEARRACGELPNVDFLTGNALALPFPPATFDAATIAFGLRNLSSFEAGVAEMARVVRPGGRVVILELTSPRPRFLGRLYRGLFRVTAPAMGALFRQRSAYAYLPHSLEGFLSAEELAATMRRVGLANVRFKRMGMGVVALHVGEVPAAG